MRNRLLLVCLVLSGFSGVAWELIWVRLLALSFGSTQLSYSTVLGVFFGGLALGSWFSGRRAARVRRPELQYTRIELGTALAGVLLYPVLLHLGDFFALIDPGPGLGGALMRLAVATPILLVPTFLMGATLPLICRATITEDADVGRGTALIYAFNTLGAFLAAYFITYHLIAWLGLAGSAAVTAVINVIAALVAYILHRRSAPMAVAGDSGGGAPESQDDSNTKLQTVAVLLTGAAGFAAVSIQVLWVRLFSIFTDGTIYGVGSVLISVLLGIAIGAFLIAPVFRATKHAARWFVMIQLLMLGSLVVQASLLEVISAAFSIINRSVAPGLSLLHAQLALVVAVTIVPACCSGASFPLLIGIIERRAERGSQALGGLYAGNTVGSICGSVFTGFFLLPHSGSVATFFAALTIVASVGALSAVFLLKTTWRAEQLLYALAAVLLLAAYTGFDPVLVTMRPGDVSWQALERRAHDLQKQTAFFSEGENATAVVTSANGSFGLLLNGLGQGGLNTNPPRYVLESVLVAMLPLVHVQEPRRGLVVGLGAGATVDVLRGFDEVKSIDVVELEPVVVSAVQKMFEGSDSPLQDAKVHVRINDARHYLRVNERQGEKFDFIASMPAHPWVAASIFTQEFFATARANLAPGGVFVSWFGDNKKGTGVREALLRAFSREFPYYAVYDVPEVGAIYLVGSSDRLRIDPSRFADIHANPLVERHEFLADGPFFLPLRVLMSGSPGTAAMAPGPVNTDDSAFVEVFGPRIRSSSTARDASILPQAYLESGMIAEAQQPEFYLELIERLLGTPGGRFPIRTRVARVPEAERTFEAIRGVLSPDVVSYLLGRLALAKGQKPSASGFFDRVGLDDEIGARAKRFRVLAMEGDTKAQVPAMAALPRDTDVLVRLMALDEALALSLVPTTTVSIAEDPVGWLLRQARQDSGDSLSPAMRAQFAEILGPHLATTNSRGLLKLAAKVARRHRMHAYAERCDAWQRAIRARRSTTLLAQARRLGLSGEFARAIPAFEAAALEQPLGRAEIQLLLQASIEVNDPARVRRYTNELHFIGLGASTIAEVLKVVKARKTAPSTATTPVHEGSAR